MFLAKCGEETVRCSAVVADVVGAGREDVDRRGDAAGQESAAGQGDAAGQESAAVQKNAARQESAAGRGDAARQKNAAGRGDAAKQTRLAKVEEIITSGECFSLSMLAVKGRDLIAQGHPPGKELGVTLSKLLAHVIERPEDNVREILFEIAEGEGYLWTTS